MVRFLIILLLGSFMLALPAAAQRYDAKLPAAPTGFAWQPLPQVKAAALLPAGWFFKVEAPQKNAVTYYLTQEPIGESGEYQTGLSLQVIRKARTQTRHSAPEYAEMLFFRTGAKSDQQELLRETSTTTTSGHWQGWTVRYRDAPPGADVRIVHHLTLANARTDTLYLLTFEGPEADWAAAWALGEIMLRELTLDSRQ